MVIYYWCLTPLSTIFVLLLEETGVPSRTLMICPFLAIDERFYVIEHSSAEL